MSLQSQSIDEEERLYLVWMSRWANSSYDYNSTLASFTRHSIVDTYLREIEPRTDSAPGVGYKQWEVTQAYAYYAFSGPIGWMAAKSGMSAYGGYLLGIYPTFLAGLGAELAMDFGLFAAALTIIDPHHQWDGGMDELGDGMFGMGMDIGFATYQDRLNPSWAWW